MTLHPERRQSSTVFTVVLLDELRGTSVAGLASSVSDLFAETGFFETDLCFFDFGGEAAGLESFFGLLE